MIKILPAIFGLVGVVIGAALGAILTPLAPHLKALVFPKAHVRKLEEQLKALSNRRADVADRVDVANRELAKERLQEANGWLESTKILCSRVNKLLGSSANNVAVAVADNNAVESNRSWRQDVCIAIRCISMLDELDRLYKNGTFTELPRAPHPPGGVRIETVPMNSTQMSGYLNEALGFINSNEGTGVIGIWGMGGVGKTALLEEINNHFFKRDEFDYVIHTRLSSSPTLGDDQTNSSSNRKFHIVKIGEFQRDIANRLNINVKEKDQDAATALLTGFLKDKNFLLLLEDLWEPLDLKAAGIPHPLGVVHLPNPLVTVRKRKVVLTTRSKDVCGNMQADSHIIKMECLNPDESSSLFKTEVGNIESDQRILVLAEEVARECGGLPLALIKIGKAMSNVTYDEWEQALAIMKASRLPEVPGIDQNIFPRLKLSYDNLPSKTMRDCFLCCSLWPKGFMIRKDDLIDCWIGLDLLDNHADYIDQPYELGNSLISSLIAACLLEPVTGDHRALSDKFVKMHDVIRDLALWIACDDGKNMRRWIVRGGVGVTQAPIKEDGWKEAERISLMNNRIETLTQLDSPDICPKLQVLMLQYNKLETKNHTLRGFRCFKSLEYLDISHSHNLSTFPEQVCELLELRFLNLSFTKIVSLPESIKSLKKLKYLHLRKTSIAKLPEKMLLELHDLQVLDLFSCHACVGKSFFEHVKALEGRLKSLGISVCNEHDLANLSMLSAAPVTALCIQNLQNKAPLQFQMAAIGSFRLLWKLKAMAIADSKMAGLVFDIRGQNQDLMTRNLRTLYFVRLPELKSITWQGTPPMKLFPNLHMIVIDSCTALNNITWAVHLLCLEHLEVRSCVGMTRLIEDAAAAGSTFPLLKTLILFSLERLEHICSNIVTFPSLEYLEVIDCDRLNQLPFQKDRSKLRKISGQRSWWDKLQWDDDGDTRAFFFTKFHDARTEEDYYACPNCLFQRVRSPSFISPIPETEPRQVEIGGVFELVKIRNPSVPVPRETKKPSTDLVTIDNHLAVDKQQKEDELPSEILSEVTNKEKDPYASEVAEFLRGDGSRLVVPGFTYEGRDQLDDWTKTAINEFLKLEMTPTPLWTSGSEFSAVNRLELFHLLCGCKMWDIIMYILVHCLNEKLEQLDTDTGKSAIVISSYILHMMYDYKSEEYLINEDAYTLVQNELKRGKKMLLFPLLSYDHWHLLVVDMVKKQSCHYSSVELTAGNRWTDTAYLVLKLLEKFGHPHCKYIKKECPIQTNSVDCGVYCYLFMDAIINGKEVEDCLQRKSPKFWRTLLTGYVLLKEKTIKIDGIIVETRKK